MLTDLPNSMLHCIIIYKHLRQQIYNLFHVAIHGIHSYGYMICSYVYRKAIAIAEKIGKFGESSMISQTKAIQICNYN